MKKLRRALEDFVQLGVDQQIARVCVWGVHKDRTEQAQLLVLSRGVTLTADQVFTIATAYRFIWQVDLPRSMRSDCFLCGDLLPTPEEQLCGCFREAEVGVWLEPTRSNIDWLREQHPRSWRGFVMETVGCVKCGRMAPITAGLVDSRLRRQKGSVWRSPRFCQPCFKASQKPTRSKRRAESADVAELSAAAEASAPTTAQS